MGGCVYTYACISVCLCNTNLCVLTTETFPHHAFSQDTNYSFFPFLMFSLFHFSTHFRFPFQIFSYFSSSTFSHISSFFLFCAKCFLIIISRSGFCWFFVLLKSFVLIWNNIWKIVFHFYFPCHFFSIFLNLFPLFFLFTFLLSSLPSFFFHFCFYFSFIFIYLSLFLRHFRFVYFFF